MMKSPFIDEEVLSAEGRPDFDPALARLAKEIPFVGAFDERRSSFDEDQLEEEEALDDVAKSATNQSPEADDARSDV